MREMYAGNSLLSILRRIHIRSLTGILSLPRKGDVCAFTFSRGVLLSVNNELVKTEIIPQAEKEGIFSDSITRDEMGDLTSSAIQQLRSSFFFCLSSVLNDLLITNKEVPVQFDESTGVLGKTPIFDLQEWMVSYFAFFMDFRVMTILRPAADDVIVLNPSWIDLSRGLKLSPQQGYVIAMIQDRMPVKTLIASVSLSENDILRGLMLFEFFQLIELTPQAQVSQEKSIPARTQDGPDFRKYYGEALRYIPSVVEKRPRSREGPIPSAQKPSTEPFYANSDKASSQVKVSRPSTTTEKSAPSGVPSVENPRSPLSDKSEATDRVIENQPQTSPPKSSASSTEPPVISVELLMEIHDLMLFAEREDYYSLLGLDQYADSKEIKANYLQMTKRFHPDKFQQFRNKDVQRQVNQIFSTITQAYEVLRDPEERRRYDELRQTPPSQTSGEDEDYFELPNEPGGEKKRPVPAYENPEIKAHQRFLHACNAYKNGNMHEATTHIREAVRMQPEMGEYQFLLAKILLQNPLKIHESEERLKIACERQPDNNEFAMELAKFYAGQQDYPNAALWYQHVLDRDSGNTAAAAGLAELSRKSTTKSTENAPGLTGYLKGFFKKKN